MPVRSDDTLWSFGDLEGISADDLLTTTFPSYDIWKKFEFDEHLDKLNEPVYEPIYEDQELDSVLELSLDVKAYEIRHHDCMLSGTCGSAHHKSESIKIARPLLQVTCPPVQPRRPVVIPSPTPSSGRSLLLNSRNNIAANITQTIIPKSSSSAQQPVGSRPDSPPSSDDDDHPRFKHELTLFGTVGATNSENKTLQFLHDAISECDFDEDSDLCDYFEESEVFASGDGECDGDGDGDDGAGDDGEGDGDSNTEPEVHESAPRDFSCESDHSYHNKGKGAQLRTDHLGVQTPSDSEEEIDVVSIGEKQITTNRNCTVLPTNPSIHDRQKLQRTVASAISSRREFPAPSTTGGIKTRLPLRLPTTSSGSSGSRKRAAGGGDGRRGGVKRGRHRYGKASNNNNNNSSGGGSSAKRRGCHNSSGGGSPAKRRGCHSSDSDTDCSEKRSLHNNMERQRRIDLRVSFEKVRELVPAVACKERAAKVVILREAASYCDYLGDKSQAQQTEEAELRREQEEMLVVLSELRRCHYANRKRSA